MKTFALLFFLMLISVQLLFAQTSSVETLDSQKLAQWRAANYRDIRYKIRLAFQKAAPLLTGEIEIRVNLTETGKQNDLVLDWRAKQFDDEREKPYAIVHQVNDTRYLIGAVRAKNERLVIPKESLKAGENFIKIQFASLVKSSGTAVTRYTDKEDGAEYIYSQFAAANGASTAFPVFDQPDLKAKFALTVICPDKWNVVSNTKAEWHILVEEPISDTEIKLTGLKDFEFEETKPISLDVFAFAAGEFVVFEDVEEATRIVKKSPPGSGIIYEPYRNPDRSRIYVRRSQTEKFRAAEKEFFKLYRVSNLSRAPKIDFAILPELSVVPNDFDGLRFLRESTVFR